ncbi:hypothetical protein [Arthrobacter sp. CDRTa11]|uniref:hypothetical protein n=1 Tax=Arthrobacter sp. CDRTa11 TaxID=2651199 RepID=UPI002265E4AF|nr:hypothetical protein [Arthrobacter sp. CDRTa11]
MSLYQPEPVEISTRIRPGEWTESSLEELVTTYRAKILAMGARVSDVVTDVERNDDGSVKVAVSWAKPALADDLAADDLAAETAADATTVSRDTVSRDTVSSDGTSRHPGTTGGSSSV